MGESLFGEGSACGTHCRTEIRSEVVARIPCQDVGMEELDAEAAISTGGWDARYAGPISVNVSAVQLADLDWHSQFVDTLTRHKVQPVMQVP
jgi:hypothetical protein